MLHQNSVRAQALLAVQSCAAVIDAVKVSDTVLPCILYNKICTPGRHDQLVTLIWPACSDLQSRTPLLSVHVCSNE